MGRGKYAVNNIKRNEIITKRERSGTITYLIIRKYVKKELKEFFIKIDLEDAERISTMSWSVIKFKNGSKHSKEFSNIYSNTNKKSFLLSKFILNYTGSKFIKYRKDKMDFRKSNLVLVKGPLVVLHPKEFGNNVTVKRCKFNNSKGSVFHDNKVFLQSVKYETAVHVAKKLAILLENK